MKRIFVIICSLQLIATNLVAQGSGKALRFNGTSDHVRIVDNSQLSFGDETNDVAFSVEGWIYPDASGVVSFIAKESSSLFQKEWQIGARGGKVFFACYDKDAWNRIQRDGPSTLLTSNKWHHLAATYDGSGTSAGIKVYINGIRVDNSDNNVGSYISIHDTSDEVAIGMSGSQAFKHDGQIDEVRIWNKELTQAEVRENMCKKLNGGEPGLVAYYRMDEGVDGSCSGGEDVCDLTGNGNNGTKY